MNSDPDPGAMYILPQLLLLVVLTCINAYFAGAEMAVVSVNKNRIKHLAENGNKKAVLVQTLLSDSTKFLSTIQVAITLANFFSSASAASGISVALGGWLSRFPIPYGETIAMIVVTVLLAFVTLIFGELVPKRMALQRAEQFSLMTIRPIYMISRILSPFIRLLSAATNLVLRVAGMRAENIEEQVTEEEIKALLESGREQGVFNEIEQDMITSIFSFDDKIARDVMVARKDVFAVDVEMPLADYLDDMLESGYSRILVYQETIDNIIGVLHMKEFIMEARRTSFLEVDVRKIMQKPYFVPETKNIDTLFRELQQKKNYIAVLIDEYGGFSGIVTVENLVEEVMGNINNEYEEETPELVQISANGYMVDGRMLLEDLNEKLHLKLNMENSDTISGFVMEYLGYIPKEEEHPTLTQDGVTLYIEEMEHKAVRKLRLLIQSDDLPENSASREE